VTDDIATRLATLEQEKTHLQAALSRKRAADKLKATLTSAKAARLDQPDPSHPPPEMTPEAKQREMIHLQLLTELKNSLAGATMMAEQAAAERDEANAKLGMMLPSRFELPRQTAPVSYPVPFDTPSPPPRPHPRPHLTNNRRVTIWSRGHACTSHVPSQQPTPVAAALDQAAGEARAAEEAEEA
jgi:hypothetical protein